MKYKLPAVQGEPVSGRKPEWLKVRVPGGKEYARLRGLFTSLHLHTVCESAMCPNQGECWRHGTATFMILGDTCTRSCRFCAVRTGRPATADDDEPRRVAEAAKALGLQYVVVTSVNRDDLPDGGAGLFVMTLQEIRRHCPGAKVELLVPDFQGNPEAIAAVVHAGPDVLNHNVETVPRLYKELRPQAKFGRSLELLYLAKQLCPAMPTKSGIMVGAGEEWEELVDCIRQISETKCDILTIGQYLRPSTHHHPVMKYYHPGEFVELKRIALDFGFKHVESGPLVRSSYHAWEQSLALEEKRP